MQWGPAQAGSPLQAPARIVSVLKTGLLILQVLTCISVISTVQHWRMDSQISTLEADSATGPISTGRL
jgi:hypothetical protein